MTKNKSSNVFHLRTVKREWEGYKSACVKPHFSDETKTAIHEAFYGGYLVAFNRLNDLSMQADMPREERAHALFGLQKELQEFSDLIIAKHRLEKKNE